MSPKEIADLIPELTEAHMAFPAGKEIEEVYEALTPLAQQWADENSGSWGIRYFSKLFYKGGPIPAAQRIEGFSEEDMVRILRWTIAAMRSYYPKHEHKEAVCGMLWATFFEEPDDAEEAAKA